MVRFKYIDNLARTFETYVIVFLTIVLRMHY
jgi:hypothetical protein